MAVHYEVPAGQSLVIAGPANVSVKGGEVPMVVDDAAELQAAAPTISALDPNTAETGGPDFTLTITGTGLTNDSVIVFGTHDEPTTLAADGLSVTTGVKPSLFANPDTVPVVVRNGPARSAALDFTFTDPGAGTTRKRNP